MTIIDAGVHLSTIVCAWCEYHLVNANIDLWTGGMYVLHDFTATLTIDCHSWLTYLKFKGALLSAFFCPPLG